MGTGSSSEEDFSSGKGAPGLVSRYLLQLVEKQVNEHGIVVWFDPEGHYRDLARHLSLPHTHVACYEGSFFALRHEIEPLLDALDPPRLVVYVPLAEEDTQDALVELAKFGVVLKPGQNPMQRNTRLAVVARWALRPVLGEEKAAAIGKQLERGQLSLADLDRLGEKGAEIASGVVTLIFGTGNPQEVALKFLASEAYDSAVEARGAAAELVRLLGPAFGARLAPERGLAETRRQLARHVLATEFMASVRGEIPQALASVPVAPDAATREACVQVVEHWRQRRDLSESYARQAGEIERELGIESIPLAVEQVEACFTFAGVERALQAGVEAALLVRPEERYLEIAVARQAGYWAEHVPELQARWALAATAGLLLREADRVAAEVKQVDEEPEVLLGKYAYGDQPWCQLDAYHRHLECLCLNFDFDLRGEHEVLEKLIAKARQRYMETGIELADKYIHALVARNYQVQGIPGQRATFASWVAPAVREGKTAYVLVDALRWEMARDLARQLQGAHTVELHLALGLVPGITAVGMAALLPGADKGMAVVADPGHKVAVELAGTVLKDRKDRVKWCQNQTIIGPGGQPATVVETKLEALLQPSKSLRAGIETADLVLVTSQEIDELCESDQVSLARRLMDELLGQLPRAVRVLFDLGCQTVILAADHGYLFAGALGSDMKIDPPGGETVLLHRRVWLGRGGAATPYFLRAHLHDFGLAGDGEVAVPLGFGAFKVQGGARAYFHGGISPQEMAIPVLVVTRRRDVETLFPSDIVWTLTPGSKKITTRLFSVKVSGQAMTLFALAPLRVRVEIRSGKKVLSVPFTASYGFDEAGDVELRPSREDPRSFEPNTITVGVFPEPIPGKASLHLLDATTGLELARLEEIEWAISL